MQLVASLHSVILGSVSFRASRQLQYLPTGEMVLSQTSMQLLLDDDIEWFSGNTEARFDGP